MNKYLVMKNALKHQKQQTRKAKRDLRNERNAYTNMAVSYETAIADLVEGRNDLNDDLIETNRKKWYQFRRIE